MNIITWLTVTTYTCMYNYMHTHLHLQNETYTSQIQICITIISVYQYSRKYIDCMLGSHNFIPAYSVISTTSSVPVMYIILVHKDSCCFLHFFLLIHFSTVQSCDRWWLGSAAFMCWGRRGQLYPRHYYWGLWLGHTVCCGFLQPKGKRIWGEFCSLMLFVLTVQLFVGYRNR